MSSSANYSTPDSNSSDSSNYNSSQSKVPLIKGCIRRNRLSKAQVLHLVFRRYGSLDDFSKPIKRWCDIARATGVNDDTVRTAVLLYHRKGNRYIRFSAKGRGGGRRRTITPDIEAQLIRW